MNIAEQALFLLDTFPSAQNRKKLENFWNLDQTISASFPGALEPEVTAAVAPENPYSVASRMNRSNYEDQARAEALTNALRQLRAGYVTKTNSRVIRRT